VKHIARYVACYEGFPDAPRKDEGQLAARDFLVLRHQGDERIGIRQITFDIRQINLHLHVAQMRAQPAGVFLRAQTQAG
jgi:hypothetical protein